MQTAKVNNVEEYIQGFPKETQKLLKQLRSLIKKTVPKAEELISYNMPAYKYNGYLVYFSGYEHHIGFYPMPSAIVNFKKEISVYKYAKGSVQFPLDEKLPEALIKKILIFRAKENEEKAYSKASPKTKK